MTPPDDIDFRLISVATVMGALIGLGQLLNSEEKLTWRYVFGRAIVSAGLAASAPAILLLFPSVPSTAQFALAALFSSLGTSALQGLLRRIVGGPPA